MYLKDHWFSIYGGNMEFTFKINLFLLLKLKYHSHNKIMRLKCAIQWFLYVYCVVQPSAVFISRTFSSSHTEALCP